MPDKKCSAKRLEQQRVYANRWFARRPGGGGTRRSFAPDPGAFAPMSLSCLPPS